jgi:hypothetical protein
MDGDEKCTHNFWLERPKGRGHPEDKDVDERVSHKITSKMDIRKTGSGYGLDSSS